MAARFAVARDAHLRRVGIRRDLDERLAELWSAVRGAAEFALAWTRQDADGHWVTSPATSPENAYRTDAGIAAVDSTTAMDLTLVRAACATAMAVGGRLGITADDVVEASRAPSRGCPLSPPSRRTGRFANGRAIASERTRTIAT